MPNGPCFLADGTLLIADTARRLIYAVGLDADGNPINERIFAQFTAAQGYPDGMTTDAENHIWIAFWDAWCVRRITPEGRIEREIPLPVQRPTCPAFGGDQLDRLYITSATTGIDSAALATQPHARRITDVGPGHARVAAALLRGLIAVVHETHGNADPTPGSVRPYGNAGRVGREPHTA